MKTIEEVAIEKYMDQQSMPKHKQIRDSNYIDWANFGAKEALRWIPIEEELPENRGIVLVRNNGFTPIRSTAIFQDGVFHADFKVLRNYDITHWRPLERL